MTGGKVSWSLPQPCAARLTLPGAIFARSTKKARHPCGQRAMVLWADHPSHQETTVATVFGQGVYRPSSSRTGRTSGTSARRRRSCWACRSRARRRWSRWRSVLGVRGRSAGWVTLAMHPPAPGVGPRTGCRRGRFRCPRSTGRRPCRHLALSVVGRARPGPAVGAPLSMAAASARRPSSVRHCTAPAGPALMTRTRSTILMCCWSAWASSCW